MKRREAEYFDVFSFWGWIILLFLMMITFIGLCIKWDKVIEDLNAEKNEGEIEWKTN